MKWCIALALAACRSAPDLSEPIDVVMTGTWTEQQRLDLEHASQCWNLGFGLDYRFDVTTDEQRVSVTFDELQCVSEGAWAFTTTGFEDRVGICPYWFSPENTTYLVGPGALFGVLTHELGHVAGIPVTVHDATSIMGGTEALYLNGRVGDPIFSAVDHALFAQYNPGFDPTSPTCEPIVSQTGDDYQCGCDLPASSTCSSQIVVTDCEATFQAALATSCAIDSDCFVYGHRYSCCDVFDVAARLDSLDAIALAEDAYYACDPQGDCDGRTCDPSCIDGVPEQNVPPIGEPGGIKGACVDSVCVIQPVP